MSELMYTGKSWNWDKLARAFEECEKIATEELKLDCYPNVIEVITFEQMLDAYSSVGMPVMYNHWSFGKQFQQNYDKYRRGHMGLALEIVINSDPCINYLMEENTMTAQTLVMAHAGFGHNSFFKNNYLFKQWTAADSIIDYLLFAKKYVEECEEKYGWQEVEKTLDAAHSLQYNGVDKYRKPKKLSALEERERQKIRDENYEAQQDALWNIIPRTAKKRFDLNFSPEFLPHGPEENLLYFLEKKSPILENWQRELIRIVRKVSQYFYPQMQTKVANEGWASTVHYYIMNRLHEKGLIDDGSMLEFLHLHSSVVFQPGFDSPYYSGFNPYHLGFSIFMDLKRMSEEPTAEDREWFPMYAGKSFLDNWHDAYENFRDDSLIHQFLSPKTIRDNRLFNLRDETGSVYYQVTEISDEAGYRDIRRNLASRYSIASMVPDIQVTDVDFDSREVVLTYYSDDFSLLKTAEAEKTLQNFKTLWGFDVTLITRYRSNNDYLDEISTEKIK